MLAWGSLSVARTSSFNLKKLTLFGEKVIPISIFEFAAIIPFEKSSLKLLSMTPWSSSLRLFSPFF